MILGIKTNHWHVLGTGDERSKSKSKFRKLEIKIKIEIQETRHPEAVELTTSIEQQGRN